MYTSLKIGQLIKLDLSKKSKSNILYKVMVMLAADWGHTKIKIAEAEMPGILSAKGNAYIFNK